MAARKPNPSARKPRPGKERKTTTGYKQAGNTIRAKGEGMARGPYSPTKKKGSGKSKVGSPWKGLGW